MNRIDPDLETRLLAAAAPEPTTTIDARGLLCPIPIVKLGQALRRLDGPGVVAVRATDPGFLPDLVTWLRVRPAELVALRRDNDVATVWVRGG